MSGEYTGHAYCNKCGQTHWMHGSCPAGSGLAAPAGWAHPSGGPEVWNVVAWGDVRECRTTERVIEEVRGALETGCRTISIERQGAPNTKSSGA